MKAIGPNFWNEIKAAGISGDGWSWAADGTIFFNSLTPPVIAQIQAVYAAHDPATPVSDVAKDATFDAFLDSTAGAAYKALVLSLRDEINTVRAALPTPLSALTVVYWRTKIKTAYRTLVS